MIIHVSCHTTTKAFRPSGPTEALCRRVDGSFPVHWNRAVDNQDEAGFGHPEGDFGDSGHGASWIKIGHQAVAQLQVQPAHRLP
jgi:hypothetical protein